MNRTLIETVRAMLSDSKLPKKFGAEALSTATYIRNRSPTNALHKMTPYEAWTGYKPKVKHLRVFGCSAYAHIPKDERKKIDPKAKKSIFLGYGKCVKGYRLYDPEKLRVFYSRDVIFNESKSVIEQKGTDKNDRNEKHSVIEIDCENTSEDEVDNSQEFTELRRSTRMRKPPELYGEWTNIAHELNDPLTITEALSSPKKIEWKKAMEKEIESLHTNDVWDLVKLPSGRKAIGCKWVFKRKHDADGNIESYKARLVAQGFNQKNTEN